MRAFQAFDPGSIPGQCINFAFLESISLFQCLLIQSPKTNRLADYILNAEVSSLSSGFEFSENGEFCHLGSVI